MMSEQQFVIDKLYYTIMTPVEKISVGRSYMTYGEVVGCLNEQEQKIQLLEKENEDLREVNKENQRLHEENVKQCERWRNLYELKDAEVTARVDALNKVCEYYLTETRFKGDTDPNEAVKEVLKEILNTEVEM